MSIAKLLRDIQNNPDDLTQLPLIISQAEKMEQAELDYQERITKLQEINRNYLSQIPIPEDKPTGQEQQEDKEPTIEEASQLIIESLTGGNK